MHRHFLQLSFCWVFLSIIGILCSDKIYVYDWPELVNRYANFTDRDHTSHGVEVPIWKTHFGAGRLVDATNLEHKTSQFALHKIFYERALIDSRRTLNPSEATTFFIPFDIGMHTVFLEGNGRMRKSGCPLVDQVEARLKQMPYFERNGGHDHLLIFAVNYNMNYFMNAAKCQHFLRLCWNCTKLSIDEYLFTAKHRIFEAKNRGINWHAIPFPSDYHYSHAAEHWRQGTRSLSTSNPHSAPFSGGHNGLHSQNKKVVHHKREMELRQEIDARKHSFAESGESVLNAVLPSGNAVGKWLPPWERVSYDEVGLPLAHKRSTVVSFTGSPRRFNEFSTLMREALIRACGDLNDTSACSHGSYRHDLKISNNELARRSVFCLQPPGDMPSRKSVFDAILSGCIPVLFHPLTARYM